MTKYLNQSIGSHDDDSYEFVSVEWNENTVRGFSFHSVLSRDGRGNDHMVYGIEVEARYVWQATKAFSTVTNIMAVRADGSKFGVTHVSSTELDPVTKLSKWEEFRMGDKWGRTVARMERGPYVQGRNSSLVEEGQ